MSENTWYDDYLNEQVESIIRRVDLILEKDFGIKKLSGGKDE